MKSLFKSEQEANEYKEKHQLFGRVAEPMQGTGKWALNFPLETHITVVDSSGMVVNGGDGLEPALKNVSGDIAAPPFYASTRSSAHSDGMKMGKRQPTPPLQTFFDSAPVSNLGLLPAEATFATVQYCIESEEMPEMLQAVEIFKSVPAKLLEIPIDAVKTAFMASPEIAASFATFDDYHRWYMGAGDVPVYGASNRWPCIASCMEGEVVQDGSHRLHAYIAAGHATIPVLAYDSEAWWKAHEHWLKADRRPIAGDPRLFIEDVGYDIREDSQQSGLWVWIAPTDGCDASFDTAKEALESAWNDAVRQTMGINDLSSEQWDAMGFDLQKAAMLRALSEDGDDVQDVVDDVLGRAEKYGFQPDEDMVRGAAEESASLLNINLSEEQIVEACERIMRPEGAAAERPLG